MIPFFDDPENRAKLRAEAASWLDTPFRARAAVKGAGVDCVQLTARIMVACALIKSYVFPRYTMDWAKHHDRSLVLEWLTTCPRVIRVDDAESPRFGDVVCFKVGRCVQHVGVALDPPHFINAVEGMSVSLCRLDDSTWQKRLDCIYRPIAL